MRNLAIILAGLGGLIAILLFAPWGTSSESLTVVRENQNVYMYWTGDVSPPMARALSSAWKRERDANALILVLDSPGGSVAEGDDVIRWLNRVAKSTDLITHVGPEAYCASMCVPIYLAGEKRSAAANATFMFHQAFSVDPVTGEQMFMFSGDQQLLASQVFHQYLRKSAMDQAWGEKLDMAIRNDEEVWKTGRELKRERSNIVLSVHDEPRP